MSRWNAARAEAQLEEELDAQLDAPISLQELERAKRQRLADWRRALSAEEAERNSNFAVSVSDDWRARVASARQRKVQEEIT